MRKTFPRKQVQESSRLAFKHRNIFGPNSGCVELFLAEQSRLWCDNRDSSHVPPVRMEPFIGWLGFTGHDTHGWWSVHTHTHTLTYVRTHARHQRPNDKAIQIKIDVLTLPSYLITFSFRGGSPWLADPFARGRKSRMLSVFTPRLGLRGMRAGLISRSCMSHFTHTNAGWHMVSMSRRQALLVSVGAQEPHLEWDYPPRGWAAGGGGALGLRPAPEATPSTPSPWWTRCSPPAAGRPRSPASGSLKADEQQWIEDGLCGCFILKFTCI